MSLLMTDHESKDGPPTRWGRIVIIHHDDATRLQVALKTADVVRGALEPWAVMQIRCVQRQPEDRPISTARLAARRARQWHVEREWAHHLGNPRRWFLSTGLLGFRELQLLDPKHRSAFARTSHIELALSAKHELAWRRAYEDAADFLVVLEDDARSDDDTSARLSGLIQQALTQGGPEDFYIDLAGGLPAPELRDSHLETPVGDGVVRMAVPATNTACAYLMGRNVIRDLAEHTIMRPERLRLPADWLIHDAFMNLPTHRRDQIICLRAKPYPLTHGSFAGTTPSSIRS